MMRTYKSAFAQRIQQFIQQKNALGHPYIESSRILQNFDRFCLVDFPNEKMLTKEIGLAWAVCRKTEGNNTFRNRLSPIREFARYLNRTGEEAYVLACDIVKKEPHHMPYIYSPEEVWAFWEVLDEITPQKNYPVRHLVIPMIFRLVYCCGLRPQEARKLQVSDVDLLHGRLSILESKCHKNRIVMMADDVTEQCRIYHEAVSQSMPGRILFFPNSQDQLYTKKWFEKTFRIFWAKTEAGKNSLCSQTIYSFRHSFATHRLYQWMKEGADLSVKLPYLSVYMGHAQLSDTYYYIHLVPEQLAALSGIDLTYYEKFLPEVKTYE